jgi:hypothetical protein
VSVEALVLGVFSGLRPGTSLAAVLTLLNTPRPRRPLLFFIAAGFAWCWVFGMLVVGVFHGANVALGGSTFTAVLEVAFGAAALGFAAGLQKGWVQPGRRRSSRPRAPGASSRLARSLHNPSARVAAAAGIGTHLPGLIYLAALNAIASERPGLVGACVRVAIYDALWFMVPLAALVLVIVRPGAALLYLEHATAWVRRHEHAVLLAGSLALGGYLLVKGTTTLLT